MHGCMGCHQRHLYGSSVKAVKYVSISSSYVHVCSLVNTGCIAAAVPEHGGHQVLVHGMLTVAHQRSTQCIVRPPLLLWEQRAACCPQGLKPAADRACLLALHEESMPTGRHNVNSACIIAVC
jgi:hypothetical protein